jgi:pimeloyl-ACP methyl ester carboxylesterase
MHTVTSRDGTTIAFDRYGEGPAIIAVSGALSMREFERPYVEPLVELLPEFTFYHYDRRGRGGSGDMLPYAVEREVEDIEALVDHAGGTAYVYGGSSGGVLALHAARRLPAIAKAVVYEPPFIVDSSHPPVPSNYVDRVTELTSAGRPGDAVALFLTFVGMPAEAVAAMRSDPSWPAFEAVAHTLAYDFTVMGETQRGRPLPAKPWGSITTPTLVVDGGKTPQSYIRPAADALVAILPNAQRRTLPDQDHAVAPEAIAPVLREYFMEGDKR